MDIDTTKFFPLLKKTAAYLGAAAGVATAIYQFAQGDVAGGFTALTAALAAVGINLPVHVQVNAAAK